MCVCGKGVYVYKIQKEKESAHDHARIHRQRADRERERERERERREQEKCTLQSELSHSEHRPGFKISARCAHRTTTAFNPLIRRHVQRVC